MRRLMVLILGVVLFAGACSGDAERVGSGEPPEPVAVADPAGATPEERAAEPEPEPESSPDPQPQPGTEPEPAAEAGSGPTEELPAEAGPGPTEELPAEAAPASTASEPESEPVPDEESELQAEPSGEPVDESSDRVNEPVADPVSEPDTAPGAVPYEPPAPDPTPLPTDPAVHIGTLDNGLTYFLRQNDSPGSNLSLRLAVSAGSVNEPGPGLGVAHFLEHMMFNGTEKYPRNEIIAALRGLGAEFGPDFNAYTSYDWTVYELDVVTTQAGAVETAFDILSQWAHAATIAEEDVIAERGIVRDELRLRYETGPGIIQQRFDRAYVAATPYAGHAPIGTAESIGTMTSEVLRDFYEAWYVPANMAVVAVGNLPVDELRVLVEEYFGIIPTGEAPPAPDTDSPLKADPVFEVAASTGQGYSYMSLDVGIPTWNGGTVGGERMELMEDLIALMLDARLNDAYEQGYLSQIDPAKWLSFEYTEGLRFFGTNLRADDLTVALGDFWSMVLSLAADGFSDADLQHAAGVIRAQGALQLESVPTIQDGEYADLYVAHFLEGADIGTVAAEWRRIDVLLEAIEPSELTGYFRWIIHNSGPIVIAVGTDRADLPTVEEMRTVIEGATPGEVPERTAAVTALMAAPEPTEVSSAAPVEAIAGAYEWTFENGATVVFVPSDISVASVELRAVSQGGWSTMEPGDRPLAGRLAPRAVRQSGLAGSTPTQVERLLEDESVALVPFIDETTEGFAGSAAATGIETMFQLLHLLVTAPQMDPQAFAEAVQIGEIVLSLAEADPSWQSWVAYLEARHGESSEWFSPVAPQEALDALTPEALLDRYRRRLGQVDDLIVAVVGDIDRDTVERMARRYVGTLPAGEPDTFVDRRSAEPVGVLRRDVVLAPDIASTGLQVYYESARDVDVALEVAADALTTILDARFDSQIREQLGATYSVGITVRTYFTPEPGVLARIDASGDPSYVETIHKEIIEILGDLVENGPGAEEWAEARAVLDAEYTHIGNADLLDNVLRRAYVGDDELPTSGRLHEQLAALEATDVQALAAELFDPDQHIDIVRVLG